MSAWNEASVKALVRDHLATYIEQAGLSPSSIKDTDDLYANGILDSYTMVEILVAVEEQTGIQADLDAEDDGDKGEVLILSINRVARAFTTK